MVNILYYFIYTELKTLFEKDISTNNPSKEDKNSYYENFIFNCKAKSTILYDTFLEKAVMYSFIKFFETVKKILSKKEFLKEEDINNCIKKLAEFYYNEAKEYTTKSIVSSHNIFMENLKMHSKIYPECSKDEICDSFKKLTGNNLLSYLFLSKEDKENGVNANIVYSKTAYSTMAQQYLACNLI